MIMTDERRQSCCDSIVKVKENLKNFKWLGGIILIPLLIAAGALWSNTNNLKLEYTRFSSSIDEKLVGIGKDAKRLEEKFDNFSSKIDKLLEKKENKDYE